MILNGGMEQIRGLTRIISMDQQEIEEELRGMIFLARGHKVMLSGDLAKIYGVEPRTLIQAVKRNIERFPSDFMFVLRIEEAKSLRSQFVILKRGLHMKHPPVAFTEQGVAMLASVLKSRRAVLVNVQIIRTFVRLRQLLATHADLARKLEELEKKYDHRFKIVFDAIRQLMMPPDPPRRRIGFHP